MKRSHFYWVLTLGALVIVFVILANPFQGPQPPQGQNVSQVCFRQECFEVELALTPEEQARGLMGVESLGQDKGMLFVFTEEGIYPFWMKDTLILLDMIWMDSQGRVVFIKEDAQPCGPLECPTINPGVRARYVLEVNAGKADRMGLKVGDKATSNV